MLTTLSRFEPHEANAILAAAALAQDRNPPPSEHGLRYSAQIEALLGELRSKLHLSHDDSTPQAMRRISEALSAELKRAILGDVAVGEIQFALGRRGDLPISGYQIAFSRGFRDFKENKRFAESVIKQADEVQHLTASTANDGEAQAGVSLFLKRVPSKLNSGFHWALVDSVRKGTDLEVSALWRIFPQRVSMTDVSSPKEALERFVGVYGIDAEIGALARGKFIENVELPLGVVQQTLLTMTKIHSEGRHFIAIQSGTAIEISDRDNVPLAVKAFLMMHYAIDIARYRADVLRFS